MGEMGEFGAKGRACFGDLTGVWLWASSLVSAVKSPHFQIESKHIHLAKGVVNKAGDLAWHHGVPLGGMGLSVQAGGATAFG